MVQGEYPNRRSKREEREGDTVLKKRHAILRIVLACLVLILILHLYATFFLSRYYGISPTDIILIVTAGVVSWYAWETRQMRKEQSMPLISIQFQEYDSGVRNSRTRFLVRNFGKGAAIDVEVNALQDIEGRKPIFKKIAILSPSQEEELLIEEVHYDDKDIQRGPAATSDILSRIRGCPNFSRFLFQLSYQNILGDMFADRGFFEQSVPGSWNYVRKET